MKKQLLVRCLLGAPIGLAVSTLITILISLTVGDGQFYAVVPELIEDCGNEINAVLWQAVFSLVYGAAWGGSSLVFKQDSWSILRQTVTHLVIVSVATLPVAYLMHWMPHTPGGIAIYFGIFFGVYLIIWISKYAAMKKRIDQFNDKVKGKTQL